MECYEDETPCQKFNIVGDNGQKIGFASFVEKMMQILIDDGACAFFRHELSSIDSDSADGEKKLTFANGVHATAEQVILNVPQRPLLKIVRKSVLPLQQAEETAILDSLHSVQTEIATKLYLYYEDAWWYKLGLTDGEYSMQGDARNMMLMGRYHDGHVKCTEEGCYGFLLADYVHDFSGDQSQYFRRFQRDRPEPVTIISNTDVEGQAFLRHAHDRLTEFHVYENRNASYSGFEAQTIFRRADPPTFAVLATWNIGVSFYVQYCVLAYSRIHALILCYKSQTFGAGGAWHHWTDISNVEQALMPMNHIGIHVINEAYSKLQGWAGSLTVYLFSSLAFMTSQFSPFLLMTVQRGRYFLPMKCLRSTLVLRDLGTLRPLTTSNSFDKLRVKLALRRKNKRFLGTQMMVELLMVAPLICASPRMPWFLWRTEQKFP